MPLWLCDFETCARPAVRTQGECILCNRHLCSQHIQNEFHSCPKWEDERSYDPAAREAEQIEINALLTKVNFLALAKRASAVRNGINCTVPDAAYDRGLRSSVMGGMNYHLEVRFEDGVTLLARIRRFNATSPPPAVRDNIIKSEVATLRFLEEIAVPAPRIYDFALENDTDNDVGIGYILMEKMPGQSFDMSKVPEHGLKKILAQLADIYLELRKHPFDWMGSLDQPGTKHVGPFARESLTDDHPGEGFKAVGPCSSAEEYHTAAIKLILDLILQEEMYTEQAIDAYIIHRYLLDILPSILVPSASKEVFFLKHADEKGDQLLVDEQHNITAVVDWEWAYTAPLNLAFNSPILTLPVNRFYDGEIEIGEHEEFFARCLDEKGGKELASAVRAGRVQHFFSFCCGYDLVDWKGFLGLFQGLRDAVGIDAGIAWDEWRSRALQRYSADDGLQILLAKSKSAP